MYRGVEFDGGSRHRSTPYDDFVGSRQSNDASEAMYDRKFAITPHGSTSWHTNSPLPSQPRQRSLLTKKEDNDRQRYVELDKNGKPRGYMADLVKRDVHAFTKELDPNEGWDKQKDESKSRLKQRLDAEYEFGRESALLGEKYLQKDRSRSRKG